MQYGKERPIWMDCGVTGANGEEFENCILQESGACKEEQTPETLTNRSVGRVSESVDLLCKEEFLTSCTVHVVLLVGS